MKANTVNRLRAGIAALKARGDSITAKTLERETGLSYQTIRRNEEAYTLYCEHADYFRTQMRAVAHAKLATGEVSARRVPRPRRVPSARPRDPLLAYTKQACRQEPSARAAHRAVGGSTREEGYSRAAA
jgi:hypothetical protein